MWGFAPVPT